MLPKDINSLKNICTAYVATLQLCVQLAYFAIIATLLLSIVISMSCSHYKRLNDIYLQKYASVNGKPYHAILEYLQEKKSGDSFAVATVEPSHIAIQSRIQLNFESQLLEFDGQEFSFAELNGKMLIFHGGKTRAVKMPNGFDFDAAMSRLIQILDNLNQEQSTE